MLQCQMPGVIILPTSPVLQFYPKHQRHLCQGISALQTSSCSRIQGIVKTPKGAKSKQENPLRGYSLMVSTHNPFTSSSEKRPGEDLFLCYSRRLTKEQCLPLLNNPNHYPSPSGFPKPGTSSGPLGHTLVASRRVR